MTHETATLLLALLPLVGCVLVGIVAGEPPVLASMALQGRMIEGGDLRSTGIPVEEAFNDEEQIVPMNSDICLGE